MSIEYQGEICLFQNEYEKKKFYYYLDLAPHIMQRIRPLLINGMGHLGGRGKFTHRPVSLTITAHNSKDVDWISKRWPILISPEAAAAVASGVETYDKNLKSVASLDFNLRISDQDLVPSLEMKPHQISFSNQLRKVKRLLLADSIGAGKTFSALLALRHADARPAIIITPTTLCNQWQREVERLYPGVSTHVIYGHKPYEIPSVDILITAYTRVHHWQDSLIKEGKFKSVVFDEVQELRHQNTKKYDACKSLSSYVTYAAGLSATPIHNLGGEIWSVLHGIGNEELGSEEEFKSEWCYGDRVNEPAVLNSYLRNNGLMLRRTGEEVGMYKGQVSKIVYTIDADMDKLKHVEDVARMLAITVLSGSVNETMVAERELDWKLRHATGVAKARPVAEFVKILLESEPKIVLFGWHRDVYDIWLKELSLFNPVMVTGSETPNQKDQAIKTFIESEECRVIIVSLRSGAGIDGLQRVASTAVFGELDWSPMIMEQDVGRLNRMGQIHPVKAFYLTIADGADPFMISLLNLKRSQHEGIVEGKGSDVDIFTAPTYDSSRIRDMARNYLESIGVAIPEAVQEVGLLGDLAKALRMLRVPSNTEGEMQEALWTYFKDGLSHINIEREVRISKKSRIDFVAFSGNEKIAIECKITSRDRLKVYKQVRRYVEEASITALILYAPWTGVSSFVVDKTPVIVIDWSLTAL